MPTLTEFTLAQFGPTCVLTVSHEFCRGEDGLPIHPGPCRGWKKAAKTVATATPAARKARPKPPKPLATSRELQAGMKSGIAKTERMAQGAQSHVERLTFTDGVRGVRKRAFTVSEIGSGSFKARDGKTQQDAEELTSLIANALGIRAPHVVRDPRKRDTSTMSFVDGKTGLRVMTEQPKGTLNRVTQSDQGIMLGFLDMLIQNQDRNNGNYLIDPDGNLAGIDHGHAFESSKFGALTIPSPFSAHFHDKMGAWSDNPMSPNDIAATRQILQRLKPKFDKLGHPDWYAMTLERLGYIEQFATGTKDRIPKGGSA